MMLKHWGNELADPQQLKHSPFGPLVKAICTKSLYIICAQTGNIKAKCGCSLRKLSVRIIDAEICLAFGSGAPSDARLFGSCKP